MLVDRLHTREGREQLRLPRSRKLARTRRCCGMVQLNTGAMLLGPSPSLSNQAPMACSARLDTRSGLRPSHDTCKKQPSELCLRTLLRGARRHWYTVKPSGVGSSDGRCKTKS